LADLIDGFKQKLTAAKRLPSLKHNNKCIFSLLGIMSKFSAKEGSKGKAATASQFDS
jgi:hypothetical protein